MKASLLAAGLLPLAVILAGFAEPVGERSAWFTDYQAAAQAARQTGKPLLVVFR